MIFKFRCRETCYGADLKTDCVCCCRILAFSEASITAVHVSIDGESVGSARSAGGPLYVLLWDPSLYLAGLHTIKVTVEVSTSSSHDQQL